MWPDQDPEPGVPLSVRSDSGTPACVVLRPRCRWRIVRLMTDAADLAIRRAAVEDVDAICELHLRSWHASYRGLIPNGVLDEFAATQDDRRVRRRLQITTPGSGVSTLVAVRRAKVVGFALTNRSRDDDAAPGTGEVSALYVDPDSVGQGVGRLLLAHAVRDLAEQGCTRATLWVLESNARARRFYEIAGWRPDGAAKTEVRPGGRLHEVRYARDLTG
jgi:ribosomal protein S18 acetylase RimI-like enzyme